MEQENLRSVIPMIRWYQCVYFPHRTLKCYMKRHSFVFGLTSYQTLVGQYDIPGSHSLCKVSCSPVRYRQHCGRTGYSAAVCMTISPCSWRPCLNTRRKIYILSFGSKEWQKKEAGFYETSALTYPHCILGYAERRSVYCVVMTLMF